MNDSAHSDSSQPLSSQVKLQSVQDDSGNEASPQLPSTIKNYMIDIDGTITEDVPNEEPKRMATCEPFTDALETLNQWHSEGHIITFFTSRTDEHRAVTVAWLDKHGFLYHGLLMGKPRGGNYHWIDNHIVRATRYQGTFSNLVKANAEIEVFDNAKGE